MLKLRPAIVVDVDRPDTEHAASDPFADGPEQRILVELTDENSGGGEPRAAIADVALVGPAEVGDEVIVNVQALDLGLGSGGFDVVHVNLTRGLDGEGTPGANVMKLNYTDRKST